MGRFGVRLCVCEICVSLMDESGVNDLHLHSLQPWQACKMQYCSKRFATSLYYYCIITCSTKVLVMVHPAITMCTVESISDRKLVSE